MPSNNFSPPRNTYGGGAAREVICEVVNRKDDPEQSGRLQVRVVGFQNDKGTIPDNQLHWGRPRFPITNPMNGGIGGTVTGAMEGSYVIGHYSDDGQHLSLSHSIGKAGKDNNGQLDQTGRNHDTNKHTRDSEKQGGDLRFDKEKDDYDDKSTPEHCRQESENPYGRKECKDGSEDPAISWSLGQHQYA